MGNGCTTGKIQCCSKDNARVEGIELEHGKGNSSILDKKVIEETKQNSNSVISPSNRINNTNNNQKSTSEIQGLPNYQKKSKTFKQAVVFSITLEENLNRSRKYSNLFLNPYKLVGSGGLGGGGRKKLALNTLNTYTGENNIISLKLSISKNSENESESDYEFKENNYFADYENEMIKFINMIRTAPDKFINEINNLIQDIRCDSEGQDYIKSKETGETIGLMDDAQDRFEDTKIFLEQMKEKTKLDDIKYNKELKINFFLNNNIQNQGNYLELDNKDIGLILENKRSEMKGKHENIIFFMSCFKDIKISLLYLLSYYNENITQNFRDIIFLPQTKEFGVGWTKERKRGFITILSFSC